MKYFIEDTTLTDIADAVREKEESTQRIPVLELAGRIRDIQSGAQLAVTLNEDRTQNLAILDDGKVFDLPSLTADADATPEDVAKGKVFYAKGYRYVGTGGGEPVLLWTNASPTSAFAAQTVSLNSGYDGYIIEANYSTGVQTQKGYSLVYPNASYQGVSVGYPNTQALYVRQVVSVSKGSIQFGAATSGGDSFAIPTRIWGVKFTL